jgi:hypothetical protein
MIRLWRRVCWMWTPLWTSPPPTWPPITLMMRMTMTRVRMLLLPPKLLPLPPPLLRPLLLGKLLPPQTLLPPLLLKKLFLRSPPLTYLHLQLLKSLRLRKRLRQMLLKKQLRIWPTTRKMRARTREMNK